MIVRISGEGQYRLADVDGRLGELDNQVLGDVQSGDEAGFASSFAAMLDHIRTHGELIGEDELEPSDLILPPPDLSFVEAGEEFTGEGLIPD